jgi:uncharacterized repeat protein (TIGR04138 family)
MEDKLRELARSDGRYCWEAYRFVFESLEPAIQLAGKAGAEGQARHVSGVELLAGMRQLAIQLFGPLAAPVWRSWGVRETKDWGRVVYALVEAKLLARRDSDTIDDFGQGFDFDEEFVRSYRPAIPPHLTPRSER